MCIFAHICTLRSHIYVHFCTYMFIFVAHICAISSIYVRFGWTYMCILTHICAIYRIYVQYISTYMCYIEHICAKKILKKILKFPMLDHMSWPVEDRSQIPDIPSVHYRLLRESCDGPDQPHICQLSFVHPFFRACTHTTHMSRTIWVSQGSGEVICKPHHNGHFPY